MKKTLLASAILASLVSVSAQAATVYDQEGTTLKVSGDVDVVAYFEDATDGTARSDSYASVNLKGLTKLSDTTTAYAEFEIDTDADADLSTDDSLFDIDELVVGLDTAYGDFSFGGTSSAVGAISDFTDVGNEFGGGQEVVSGDGATGFAYSNTFSGLTLNAEFKASDVEDEDSVGVSAVYSLDFGLDLGLGYVTFDEANELAVALGYSVADLYVGLGYAMGETDATTEFTSMQLAVTYQATDDLSVKGFFTLADKTVGDTTTDTTDSLAVEFGYSLASNVGVYAGYAIDNVAEENALYTSISYDF